MKENRDLCFSLCAIFEGGCSSGVDEANIVADIAASEDEGGGCCALLLPSYSFGPFTYDVRTEGGGGLRIVQNLRMNSTDWLREKRTRGKGVKKSQKFADVICERPPIG